MSIASVLIGPDTDEAVVQADFMDATVMYYKNFSCFSEKLNRGKQEPYYAIIMTYDVCRGGYLRSSVELEKFTSASSSIVLTWSSQCPKFTFGV